MDTDDTDSRIHIAFFSSKKLRFKNEDCINSAWNV